MPRSFFGNMLIALQTSISTTTLSSTANATTSSVTASVSGVEEPILIYGFHRALGARL